MAPEASSTTNANTYSSRKTRPSKIPCEICGLLFDTVDIKEEHKKLEHVEQKRPSGVG
jgi:proteasome lid subunit RPN8/RPN11